MTLGLRDDFLRHQTASAKIATGTFSALLKYQRYLNGPLNEDGRSLRR